MYLFGLEHFIALKNDPPSEGSTMKDVDIGAVWPLDKEGDENYVVIDAEEKGVVLPIVS